MKNEDVNDAKKAVAVQNFTGGDGSRGGVQGTGGVRGPAEGVGSFHPFSAATVRGLLLPSTAKQVPSWCTSRDSNGQSSKIELGRRSASPLTTASRLWSFGSAEISPGAAADISTLKGQPTGMNRWKGDARKPVDTPDNVGGKADSADSSFGSTLSKKSKSDFKLRANQAFKSQSKENLPSSTFKQSMSHNNEAGSPMDVQRDRDLRKQSNAASREPLFPDKEVFSSQKAEPEESLPLEPVFDMYHVRSIILRQEAEFRDQVRELHRLHKVQTLLMAEMRRKNSDLMSHPSRIDIGGPSQSPAAFAMNSGQANTPRGQGFRNTGNDYESSIVMPEFLKGGSTFRQMDSPMTRPPQEANLFKQSARVPPARRTFDLERPPDEEDDEQPDCTHEPEGNCIKFIESPESCTNGPEPESDMFSLNLSSGWSRGKAVRDDSEQANKAEYELSRASKRPREEAALFPFLAIKSESLREAPVRPTPTTASQKFLGGLWGLQLGGKLEGSSAPDRNRSPDRSEAPKKKERLSLNLEVEEKEMRATSASNGAPHWLLKAPAAKPPKKTVCQTQSSSLNFQDSFSPPRNSSEQGMMRSSPQGRGEIGPAGMVWESERHVSDNPPRNRSQSSNTAPEMSEDNMQAGATGACQVQMVNVGPTGNERAGYGPVKPAQGAGEAPGEALSPYRSWREGGEAPSNSIPHGVFNQSIPIAGGFGVQLRTFDGHPGLAAQGLVQVGHAVNMGAGSIPFVPESGPGMWFQQVNSEAQYHQFQPQQQLASRQTGVVSSSRQGGPWQAPMKLSQGGGYGQGAVFAIPAAAGPSVGFPLYGVQKVGEDRPGPDWTPGNVGPPFTPFSIVVPPKPPFKRPPKLVLTHDGTTMELKVVSPDREVGAKVVTEKSFSGSSDEELNEKKDGGSADVALLNQRRGHDERESMQSRGRRERDKRASNTGSMKEKDSAGSGGAPDWMTKVLSTAAHRSSQTGRTGMQNVSGTVVPMAQQEGIDDGDGGSSDAGSGGSGVGDVINPGEGASPPAPVGTFVKGGSKRNLPAGEGEEGINMGELGLQADSESQSGRFGRKDKPHKNQEESQEQLSASLSLRSSLSTIARKISRGSSDGPGHVVDNTQKSVRGTDGLSEEAERRAPAFHHVSEQSGSSSGGIMNLLVKESQSHGLCKQQNSEELRIVQRELPQPSCSTSQSRVVPASKLEDSENQGKESSKGTESSASGLGTKVSRAQHRGRVPMDIDDTERGTNHVSQRNTCFANFGDVSKQERECKTGHSKQLSGANTSEKDGVQHKPYSPMLRQVSGPSSTVDMERHAEGSSKKVSQASETDQGNGRSPQRTSEWIGSTSMEQNHLCFPGGIDSSGEEVDGTLTSCNDSSITWSELEEEVQRTW